MPVSRRHSLLAFLVAISSSAPLVVSTIAAAQTFPAKPVHIVVPFAAGTAPDLIARLIAEHLRPHWQQPIVVENRGGASGNIAAAHVARSPADGHTLLASPPPPLSINRFLFKSLPFKPSDLAIVTVMASAPNVLVARPAVQASDVAELMALARARPLALKYASTGTGGTPHLTMEWLMATANVQLVHVPYAKGLAPAFNDLLGGHVDLMFANLADAKPHVDAGRLKALAVTSVDMVDALPGIQPISRTIAGLIAETWFALAAPSETPSPVVRKIAQDVAAALRTPAVAERFRTLSLNAIGSSPEEASAFVEADSRRWRSVIDKIGLHPE
jgi:tripartite-type tricarboxylate transporter receptor subunit TctC